MNFEWLEKEHLENAIMTVRGVVKNIERLRPTDLTSTLLHYVFVSTMRKLCEQESAEEEEPEAADYEDNEDLLESVDITRNIDEKQYGVLKLISYLMKLMRTYQNCRETQSWIHLLGYRTEERKR